MKTLLPITLRGTGTVDVESFSSYLHRLAQIHNVSIRKILIHAFEKYYKDSKRENGSLSYIRSQGDLSIYVRPNDVTRTTVNIIEKATGVGNLKSGTFLSVESSLHRAVGVYSRHMRWCPDCMEEFFAQDDPGYYKLIWSLTTVEHCPIHGSKLRDKCPHCGAKQGLYGQRVDAIFCQKCKGLLGEEVSDQGRIDSWYFESPDLLELVTVISRNSELCFPRDGVRNIVSQLYDDAWNGNQEHKLWGIIPRKECISIDSGQTVMTLTIARRMAFRLGVDLVSLLSGDIEQCPGLLDPEWYSKLPREVKPRKKKKPYDRKKLHSDVLSIIKRYKQTHPVPLKVVAKEVGVSTGCLQYHFPVLAQKIVEDYKLWHKEELIRKRQRARAEALKFFTRFNCTGKLQSRKAAYKEIREKTGLSKFMLKEEINQVYNLIS